MSDLLEQRVSWGITEAEALRMPPRWPAVARAQPRPARPRVHVGAEQERPALRHRWRAVTRLRLAVWEAVQPGMSMPISGDGTMQGLVSDGALRAQMRRAFDEAAVRTGLGSAEAVASALQGMAEELAVLEALRERLLARMQAAVLGLAGGAQAGSAQAGRIGRDGLRGLAQMQERFAAAEDLTANILSSLADVATFRARIRAGCAEIGRAAPAWDGLMDMVERGA